MKKIALIVVAFILLVNGVGAMNTSSIENQIIMAQQKLEKIENELLAKDTELFLIAVKTYLQSKNIAI